MRTILGTTAAAALVVAAVAFPDEALDAAAALVEKGRYAEARPALVAACTAEPENGRAHAYLGLVLLNLDRDAEGAIERLEKAARIEPENARYQVWLGSAYAGKAQRSGALKALGAARKAKAAFERAVELDAASVSARQALFQYVLGAPGIAGGSVAEARAQAAAIGRLDARRGHLAVAAVEAHEKNWPVAEQAYRAAIAADETLGATHNAFGYFLLGRQRTDEAIAEFRRYVELSPDEANAHDSLGEGLAAGGRLEEAAASYRRALELDPAFASSVWGLGDCLERLGQRQESLAQYRRYLELVPKGGRSDEVRKRLARS